MNILAKIIKLNSMIISNKFICNYRYADPIHISVVQWFRSRRYVWLLRFGRFGTTYAEVFVVEEVYHTNATDPVYSWLSLDTIYHIQVNRFAFLL